MHCDQIKAWCDGKIDGSTYSPKGEIFIDKWGSLRHAGNVAAICVRAASLGVNTDKYMAFARQQVHYILGSTGRSFVVGYGVNPPTHCHHRGASCYGPNSCCDPNCPDANPNVLTGGDNIRSCINDMHRCILCYALTRRIMRYWPWSSFINMLKCWTLILGMCVSWI